MIDPKLLTPEAGFMDCCAVEVQWPNEVYEVGYFPCDDWGRDVSEVVSIRPLTGPMAIWNFLPRNVKAVVLDDTGWPVHQYFDTMPDSMLPVGCVHRPFWAQKKA